MESIGINYSHHTQKDKIE